MSLGRGRVNQKKGKSEVLGPGTGNPKALKWERRKGVPVRRGPEDNFPSHVEHLVFKIRRPQDRMTGDVVNQA